MSLPSPPPRRVTVTYEASPSRDVWERIQGDLKRHVPLRDVQWKSATHATRTIASLDVDFRPLPEVEADANASGATSHQRNPALMNILFVACDDPEAYRLAVRGEIRRWLDLLEQRGAAEWLIVHVTAARSSTVARFSRKSNVLSKIKADFNPPKRDRCIQVPYSGTAAAESGDLTPWEELSSRLRDGLLATFETKVASFEEAVRALDAKRGLPGWSFCNFFSQKEVLAELYEELALFDDALIQYDELDAALAQNLRDDADTWASRPTGIERGSDSYSILSYTRKPYRDLIRVDKVSLFDLRIYLFARQCALLGRLGRVAEVAIRAAKFISLLGRTLHEIEGRLSSHFTESWTYSACLTIVGQCQEWAAGQAAHAPLIAGYLCSCAEMLELARVQLDRLGIDAHYLSRSHPFDMSLESLPLDEAPSAPDDNAPRITRKDLLAALESQEAFDKLYLEITNRAIDAYQRGGRKRSALKLHASVAALEKLRGRTAAAQRLYSHLPAHYVNGRWQTLESALLDKCAELQGKLGMSREWLLSTLALVRSGIEYDGTEWNQDHQAGKEDRAALASRLVDDIRMLAAKLEKDFAALAFPTFSVGIASGLGRSAEDDDGSIVKARVTNLLPCTIAVDALRLKFSGPSYDQLWFSTGPQTLPPGSTDIELSCPTPVVGLLALELSQIRISRIIFQYSHRPPSVRNLAPDPKSTPITSTRARVFFAKDLSALDADVSVPEHIHLDQERACIVTLRAGRNNVSNAEVNLSVAEPLGFDMSAATIEGGASSKAHATETAVIVSDLPANGTVRIMVPFAGVPAEASVPINLNVDYFTDAKPDAKRAIRKLCSFPLALPLAVSVQDFFRPEVIISRFSVSTDGQRPLRIKSATLSSHKGVTVEAARPPDAEPLLLDTSQISNFLFRLRPTKPLVDIQPMRLQVTYCTIAEEVVALAIERLRSRAKNASQAGFASVEKSVEEVLRVAVNSMDLTGYLASDTVRLGPFSSTYWRESLREIEGGEGRVDPLIDFLQAGLSEPFGAVETATLPWQTLSIPVELPSIPILNVVTFEFPAGKITTVGKSLAVRLSIKTIFRWAVAEALKALKKQPPTMVYDVHPFYLDWVISGKSEGAFVASDDGVATFDLSITALREGSLFLPAVIVQPSAGVDQAVSTCETHLSDAAERIQVVASPAPPSPSPYHVVPLSDVSLPFQGQHLLTVS